MYDTGYSCVWPEKHRFPMNKFHHLHNCLIKGSVITTKDLIYPYIEKDEEDALMKTILDVHDPSYYR